jgi:hypothetical protein
MKYLPILLAVLCQSALADELVMPGSGNPEYVELDCTNALFV